jgi:hypothetical protein
MKTAKIWLDATPDVAPGGSDLLCLYTKVYWYRQKYVNRVAGNGLVAILPFAILLMSQSLTTDKHRLSLTQRMSGGCGSTLKESSLGAPDRLSSNCFQIRSLITLRGCSFAIPSLNQILSNLYI